MMHSSTTIEALSGPLALDHACSVWKELETDVECSYFQTWVWAKAWHETLETDARITVIIARSVGGNVLGLLPVAKLKRRVHRRIPWSIPYYGMVGSGGGAGDHLGPLVSDGTVLEPLGASLKDLSGTLPIMLENLDGRFVEKMVSLLDSEVIDRVRCPRLTLPSQGDLMADWPKKLRQNVERRGRLLSEAGIQSRWIPPSDELTSMLGHLQDLHTRRWQAKGGEGLFSAERLNLLASLSKLAQGSSQGPWLLVKEHEGTVVAALLGFRHKDTFSVYKTGWNPEYKRYGLGIALAAAAMRWMQSEGLTVFDYLRGSEPHKYEFGAVDAIDYTLLTDSGLRGRLLRMREATAARRAGDESGRGL
jgi:CelD/BcsL family acetyltransferase involved in cellulose biosynthesis